MIKHTDIDECLEKRSGCEQLCQNTLGSFSCSCLPGFVLNADKTTCSQTGPFKFAIFEFELIDIGVFRLFYTLLKEKVLKYIIFYIIFR